MQDIPETPEDFLIEKNPNHLNISELINITNLKNKTHNHNEYLIVLHQKLSKPFLCIICILISIPVSTQLPRKIQIQNLSSLLQYFSVIMGYGF